MYRNKGEQKDEDISFNREEKSESIDKLNKIMEKLRARLFTIAEASLPGEQASSFKKAVKDYTSESWNELTQLIQSLENR